jgi:hypothetical protein
VGVVSHFLDRPTELETCVPNRNLAYLPGTPSHTPNALIYLNLAKEKRLDVIHRFCSYLHIKENRPERQIGRESRNLMNSRKPIVLRQDAIPNSRFKISSNSNRRFL